MPPHDQLCRKPHTPAPQLSVRCRGTRLMFLIQRHHSFNWFIDWCHQPLNASCWHPVNETTSFIGILTVHLNVKFFHISAIMVAVHVWPQPAFHQVWFMRESAAVVNIISMFWSYSWLVFKTKTVETMYSTVTWLQPQHSGLALILDRLVSRGLKQADIGAAFSLLYGLKC